MAKYVLFLFCVLLLVSNLSAQIGDSISISIQTKDSNFKANLIKQKASHELKKEYYESEFENQKAYEENTYKKINENYQRAQSQDFEAKRAQEIKLNALLKQRSKIEKTSDLFLQKSQQQSLQQLQQKSIIIDSKETEETIETESMEIDKSLNESISESVVVSIIEEESEFESESEFELIYSSKRLRGPSQFDSRIEINQLDPNINWQLYMLLINKSVGMIVEKDKLIKISNAFYQLEMNTTLKQYYNLCDNSSFNNQTVVGAGTAFISSNNSMLTAKHVFQKPLDQYVVVFGYEITNSKGVVESIIHKSNIYYPKEMLHSFLDLDVSHFSVDREFNADQSILSTANSKDSSLGDEIYMIGHPSGLPKKIAVNAGVLENNHSQYFYTSLDSFQGNSGSPVFDFKTNKVIGILVSGEVDYIFNGNCNEVNSCAYPYCKGEKVIRIEEVLKRM